jgi:hypothetical protein
LRGDIRVDDCYSALPRMLRHMMAPELLSITSIPMHNHGTVHSNGIKTATIGTYWCNPAPGAHRLVRCRQPCGDIPAAPPLPRSLASRNGARIHAPRLHAPVHDLAPTRSTSSIWPLAGPWVVAACWVVGGTSRPPYHHNHRLSTAAMRASYRPQRAPCR